MRRANTPASGIVGLLGGPAGAAGLGRLEAASCRPSAPGIDRIRSRMASEMAARPLPDQGVAQWGKKTSPQRRNGASTYTLSIVQPTTPEVIIFLALYEVSNLSQTGLVLLATTISHSRLADDVPWGSLAVSWNRVTV